MKDSNAHHEGHGPRKDLHGEPWLSTQQRATIAAWIAAHMRRRGSGGQADPLPTDPRKPDSLSGGAAAALDFD